MFSKKGELTTQQLVMIIILIASFAIILFLFYRLNLGETTDKEVCHNSVLLQDKPQLNPGNLDCRTNYLCVSGGNKCTSITQSSEVKVQTSDLNELKNQTFKALADEMADCWWQFGEGKIDYIGVGVTDNFVCGVCSITAFDKKVQDKLSTTTYREFYNYLRTTKKSDSQTYLQYIYSKSSLDDFGSFNPSNYLDNNIDFSKDYFILTGMIRKGAVETFFTTPSWKIWDTESNPQPVVILEKTPENYNSIGCDSFITKA